MFSHDRPARRLVCLSVAALLACAAGPYALARPANLDRTLDRLSDRRLFRVRLVSEAEAVPLHKLHRWKVHITAPDGTAVSDAAVLVDGGMPEHGHGLPTKPVAAPAAGAGDYVISGMKFSMGGWWEIRLAVRAGGQSDTITFNIVL